MVAHDGKKLEKTKNATEPPDKHKIKGRRKFSPVHPFHKYNKSPFLCLVSLFIKVHGVETNIETNQVLRGSFCFGAFRERAMELRHGGLRLMSVLAGAAFVRF